MINKQAIDYLQDIRTDSIRQITSEEEEALQIAIKALEQQKTGRWLPLENGNPYWRRCSECDAHRRMIDYLEHYCPNCGAKMQEE